MAQPPAPATSSPTDQTAQCPPWCTVDHDRTDTSRELQKHTTDEATVKLRKGMSNTHVATQAIVSGDRLWQCVYVGGYSPLIGQPAVLFLDARDAGDLANVIDALAAVTPVQYRRFAESIRRNAALIKDTPGGRE